MISVPANRAACVLSIVIALGVFARPLPAGQSDLDAFMAQVLARRDENWKKLQQYLLEERERIVLEGAADRRLWGEDRTYLWYIRDGFFVRSPLRANGVEISEADRREYEDRFLARARSREPGKGEEAGDGKIARAPGTRGVAAADELGGLIAQSRQPQFIDAAYFLRFRFEAGTYAFVGRETIDAIDTLRIEYYPTRLFSHEDETKRQRAAEGRVDRREDVEAAMERLMNKVSLVTLWITPDTRQIVKYTFENVSLDFLPAAWLVRVNDLKASMTMSQPFAGVWLPRDVDMELRALLAAGPIVARYRLEFSNYREAATSGRLIPLANE